ncbi:MAG: hypothetical protein ABS35_28945 [Kaistia sp. SCN 65-12]|nr:MAG: hypothetical protein ABS35_28945 [Kaistia sp. SCN 65-12]
MVRGPADQAALSSAMQSQTISSAPSQSPSGKGLPAESAPVEEGLQELALLAALRSGEHDAPA